MGICVFLAVLAGSFLADKLDEKKTTFIAGILFIVFAFESLLMIE
jgi:putative Ca2+/H+ antiporter (TMEM165/GDT1 family)